MEKWRGLCLVVVVAAAAAMGVAEGQLRTDFYRFTCPNVEAIVQQVVSDKISQTFVTIPATLRLFFHDCFVEGCDASIMIQSPNGDAEKDDHDNISLAGDAFDTVIKAKQAVEAQCPGVVSCADIVTIIARDVVTGSGGPFWGVELGRRDGLISNAGRVSGNLPQADSNLDLLNSMFRKNNLTQTDMVALSGAHTLGFSHCDRFANRIHSSIPDPSLDSNYALKLMQDCPVGVDPSIVIDMDPTTPRVFDNAYYTNLVEKKGLLSSDQVLFTDPASRGTVVQFASDNAAFTEAFVEAMVKLGRTAVKVGFEGEIRRDCTMFN